MKSPREASALKGLRQAREEGVTRRHWETVRDCNRFEACVRQDEALFQHVYFGTPYEGFRIGLLRDSAGSRPSLPPFPGHPTRNARRCANESISSPVKLSEENAARS